MNKKITFILLFLFIFLHSNYIHAQDYNYIEIFDPKENKVVKTIKSNSEIQAMVKGWITNIQGMYGKFDPITDDGYAIKVPLDPPVKIQCKWLNATVDIVYILIPEKDDPFYIMFEDNNRPVCFLFNGDINSLSESLNFRLKK